MSRTEKKKDPTDWPEVANKEREIITAPTGHNELFYLELKWVHVICPLTSTTDPIRLLQIQRVHFIQSFHLE